ncbi:MAG: PAS domain S-box protein, partial [Methanobacteriota archaeon]
MSKSPVIRVLFVDDNQDLGNLFQLFLEGTTDFNIYTCTSAESGLDYLSEHTVDAIISDYSMPDMNGIEFLKVIRQQYPEMPFIILTGDDSKETAIDALNSGADFYQNKGGDLDIQIIDITHKIRILVSQREAEKSIRRKDAILEAISYAADQFLKGNLFQIDSHAIISQLGNATEADQVCLYNIKESKESGSLMYDIRASWSRTGVMNDISPLQWPQRWHQVLADSHPFSGNPDDGSSEESEFLKSSGIKSILILPINANAILCGYLIFINQHQVFQRSAIEIQTLRMAAEVIGSARYRKHIEEFFKCPVEEAILGIFLLCGNDLRYVNPRICSIFGYQREELLKMEDPLIIIHPNDREMVRKHIYQTLEGSDPTHPFECIGVKKDQKEIFLEIYLTTIKCQGSQCVAGNLIDVSDRKMIQQSLQESEQRYRRLAEQLDDLIIVIDTNWQISYANPAASSVFPRSISGDSMDVRDILKGDIFIEFINIVQESMNDGSIRAWSMEISLPEQGRTWYDISITPLKVDDSQISSIVIYFHDVSYRVQKEEEIR